MDNQIYNIIREQSQSLAKLAAKNGIPLMVSDLATVEDCKNAICVAKARLQKLGASISKLDGVDPDYLKACLCETVDKIMNDNKEEYDDDADCCDDDEEEEEEEEDYDEDEDADDDNCDGWMNYRIRLHLHN